VKRTIDDLLLVKASTMAAAGLIGLVTRSTTVQFGDVGYAVGVKVHRFPKCGGWWGLFICPRCGGGAQRLRLLDDRPACGKCVRASGLIYRSQSIRTEERHVVTAPDCYAEQRRAGACSCASWSDARWTHEAGGSAQTQSHRCAEG
jgi:hypothetical protein